MRVQLKMTAEFLDPRRYCPRRRFLRAESYAVVINRDSQNFTGILRRYRSQARTPMPRGIPYAFEHDLEHLLQHWSVSSNARLEMEISLGLGRGEAFDGRIHSRQRTDEGANFIVLAGDRSL